MAEVTLKTLRSAVRFRGDYQNLRKFSDSDVNAVIQRSFGAFHELVAKAHQGYLDKEDTVTTTASTRYVALPPDAWRVQAVDIVINSEPVELAQVGLSERNKYGTGTGTPLAYRLSARGIELFPTPDAAYSLRVSYTPKAPKLSESQPQEYYNGWEDYVIEASLLELDKREGKPLSDRITAIKLIVERVSEGVSERRSQEPEYLNLREVGDWDPFRDGIM